MGFLYKSKIQKVLNENFINYDGPIHIATNKRLVDEKEILSGAMYMNAKIQKYIKKLLRLVCVAPEYGKKLQDLYLVKI